MPLAEALARRGARLALVARSAEDLGQVARALSATGAEALPLPADVTDPAARAHAVAETCAPSGPSIY